MRTRAALLPPARRALAALALLVSGRVEAGENRVERVRVVPAEGRVTVRVDGTEPPGFVVFEAREPFRVVLDWSGSQVGAARPVDAAGFVRGVRLEDRRAEAERLSRIAIELGAPTRYEVRTEGTSVVLDFAVPAGWAVPPAAPAREPAPPLAALALPEGLTDREGPLREPRVDVPGAPPPVEVALAPPPPVEPASRGPARPATARVAPAPRRSPRARVDPTPPRPRDVEVPEALRTAPLPEGLAAAGPLEERAEAVPGGPPPLPDGLAAARAALDAPVPESPRAESPILDAPEAAVPRRSLAPRRLAASAEAPPAKPAPPPPAEAVEAPPRRLAASAEAPPATPAPPPPAEAVEAPPRRLAASAEAPPATPAPPADAVEAPPRRLARLSPAPPAKAPPPAKSERLAVFRPEVDSETRPAFEEGAARSSPSSSGGEAPAEPAPPPAFSRARPAEGGPDAADPGRRTLTYIGFRQAGETSRVFVRLDGRARYRHLPSPADDTFVLELVNTTVNVENNTRGLDTSYFPGPITWAQAKRFGTSTHVEVRTRAPVEWKVKRLGTTIAIDFVGEAPESLD